MATEPNQKRMKTNNELVPIKDMIYLCLSKWKWFAASLTLSLLTACLYIYFTPSTYVRSTSFLLKNTQTKQPKADNDFSINSLQINTTTNDEVIALQSPLIMEKVVQSLDLENEYSVKSNLRKRILYGKDLPIQICFLDSLPADNISMTLRLFGNDEVEIYDFKRADTEYPEVQTLQLSQLHPILTPIGKIVVIPNPDYQAAPTKEAITLHRRPIQSTINSCLQNLTVEVADEKSGLIELSFVDVSQQRAEDVLNALISAYDSNWLKEQNVRTVNATSFIHKRLNIIEKDLGEIEGNMSSYKSENLITDVNANSGIYMQQSQDIATRTQTFKTQQSILRYVRYCLSGEMTKFNLLPVTGLENSAIESQVSTYNALIVERNKLISNGDQHPQIAEIEQTLGSMRSVILSSIDNIDASISVQIKDLEKNAGLITEHIASSPEQTKHLLSIERQQKVKESIYLFLLQRLEETELNGIDILSNIRIITPVSGDSKPIAPLKNKCLLLALAIGLFIPLVIIFIMEISDTMVNSRKDLENTSLPFIGEIPLVGKKRKFWQRKKTNKQTPIVVEENSSNVINEAFRIVRTNLSFIWGKEDKSKVIMLTSYQSDSGKTFNTVNLAMSFAIQKKRVLVIDLDMRKASASKYINSPHVGISSYLNGTTDEFEKIIVRGKLHPNMDFIPVGVIPPNPTELLSDNGLAQILNSVRSKYDYILIDCPPLNLVADSRIINKYVDMTLFVIRSGYMDKALLLDLEDLYEEHNRTGICVLLNGIEFEKRYGYGRYGYGKYSYSY